MTRLQLDWWTDYFNIFIQYMKPSDHEELKMKHFTFQYVTLVAAQCWSGVTFINLSSVKPFKHSTSTSAGKWNDL